MISVFIHEGGVLHMRCSKMYLWKVNFKIISRFIQKENIHLWCMKSKFMLKLLYKCVLLYLHKYEAFNLYKRLHIVFKDQRLIFFMITAIKNFSKKTFSFIFSTHKVRKMSLFFLNMEDMIFCVVHTYNLHHFMARLFFMVTLAK